MNDAKGHASNLLILSLATALVGAGILSWALTQSNLFKEHPRTASSLAIKNIVSEDIMTNKPAQNPVEIKIPDITTTQAINPDEATQKPDAIIEEPKKATLPVAAQPIEPTNIAEKASSEKTTTQEQEPEVPAKKPIVAEKIILSETLKNEIAATAQVTPLEAPQNNVAQATPEATKVTPIESSPIVTEATVANTFSPEEVRSTTEASITETIPPETLQDEIAATTPEADTAEIPEDGITIATSETETTETVPSEALQNEAAPITIGAPPTEAAAPEAPPTEAAPPEDTAITLETLPNANTQEKTSQITTEPSDEGTQIAERTKDGWIYAGQYKNGKWGKTNLGLPADTLPNSGSIYRVIANTTVRLALPKKRKTNGTNLAKGIGSLTANQEIEVIRLKYSGNDGHIWLEIKY